MDIAVFGDSFTQNEPREYTSWFEDFDCFGLGGTDIWYSYKNFLNHHENYDRIIFACTSPYRVCKYHERLGWLIYTNPDSCKLNKKKHPTFSLMQQYLTHISTIHDGRDETFCDLMVDKILNIRPDTLFIKCFETSPGPPVLPLNEVRRLEQRIMDRNDESDGLIDIRLAHLTEESHTIIKSEVKKALHNNDTWLDMDLDLFSSLKLNKHKYFLSSHLVS